MSAPSVSEPYPITAYAVGNALGTSTSEVVAALESGRSGLAPCRLELPFQTAVGALPDDLPALPRALSSFDSRVARIASLVFEEIRGPTERALRRWGADRMAIVVGTSTGGILETERALGYCAAAGHFPGGFDLQRQHAFHGLLEGLRSLCGAQGVAWVVSTACSSSAKALGSARRLLSSGLADAVLVGAADSLCGTTLRGFESLQALSRTACRPFCATRDGLSLGEGGAFLLLERSGDGPARLLGVGESSDAHHMSHPHPEGLGAEAAMREALAQAGLAGAEVDHVNAHGTATPANDLIEARAIRRVVGPTVPVCSTKGYTGHMLGAAGLTEAVFAVVAIERGIAPASLGADPVDPQIEIDIAREARRMRVRRVLSNSFAFGGNNACVLMGASR